MVIYLEVVAGGVLGQQFKIWEGALVGRTQGDVQIDDAKISSLHASVEKDDRGNLVLVDRDSANGLTINARRVKRVAMLLGVRFQIGRVTLRVAEIKKDEKPPQPDSVGRRKTKNWKEQLLGLISGLATPNIATGSQVQAFRPALQLDFLEGAQMDQNVILGYGPRRFGSDVLDVELLEPMCPQLAFEILVDNGDAIFRTDYPSLVLVNNKPIRETSLKEGDQIRLGQTLIRVGYAS